jgi:transposase-like protein
LGATRRRTTIHDEVWNADSQPDSDVDSTRTAADETLIRINGQRHWLFAIVDHDTNQAFHARLFRTRATQLTVLFFRPSNVLS